MWTIFADYHTHTRYSHGKGTIRDNVEAARRQGLSCVAITDHGPANIGFGIRSARDLLEIKEECRRLSQEFDDIQILAGVEANVISLDGELDVPREILGELDILLVGLHDLIVPGSFRDGLSLVMGNFIATYLNRRWTPGIREANTRALVEAVYRYEIDIITHPGLKLDIDTRHLARACRERQTALEINSAHGFLTEEFVRVAAAEGARFAVDSDAHSPARVGDLEAGIRVARAAGLTPDQIINARPATPTPRGRQAVPIALKSVKK